MKPEDWTNFRKAQMQGELNLIKNGPWYYRLFAFEFMIIFVGFVIFFITRVIDAYQFQKEFDSRWEQNRQFAP